jgi:hypothetical protein
MNVILGTPHEGWELPSNAVIQEWLRSSPEWAIKFAHAKMSQAEIMFDQLLDIADDGTNDLMTDKHGNEHVNAEVLARSRLRVDTRRWMLGRLNSRKYGDALKLQGDAEQPLEVRNSQKMDAAVSSLSPENQKMLLEALEKAQEADE